MRAGDYIVAYQAGVGVLGFAQLKSRGYKARGSENFDMFDLRSSPAIWLETPIPLGVVKRLPRALDTFEFVRSGRGTVFAIEPGGFERMLGLALAFNPEISTRLIRLGF
jgi:hypothetical protein